MSNLQHHLALIQNVITRMATHSFAIKSLTVTLTSALIALVSVQDFPTAEMPIAGTLPIFVLWLLDTKYLQQEKKFRKLYDGVRTGAITDEFTMDIRPFKDKETRFWRIAFSWSIFWVYLFSAIALVAAYSIAIGL